MKVLFKKLYAVASLPTRTNETDAGVDFYSTVNTIVPARGSKIIPLGVGWEVEDIPKGNNVYCQIQSRSGLAFKQGIEVTNAGVIDQEYRGEFGVKLYNNTDIDYPVCKFDRICQGIVKLLPQFQIVDATSLSQTERGENGFGSSGK